MLDFFFRTSGVRLRFANCQVLEGGFNFTASVRLLCVITSSVRLIESSVRSIDSNSASVRCHFKC